MKEYMEPEIQMITYGLKDIIADSYYTESSQTTSNSSDVISNTGETPIDDGPIVDIDGF